MKNTKMLDMLCVFIRRAALAAILIAWVPLIAYAQNPPKDKLPPTIQWHVRECVGGGSGLYSSVAAAQSELAASCSAPCVQYGVDTTPYSPDVYYAGADVYDPCLPRTTFQYVFNADTIGAIGSCATPGYQFETGSVPGGGQTSGDCWIWLIKFDQTQKPCDHCVGNPILPGIGDKRQEDTDYEGTGIAPLTFSRIYNSAPQFGLGWRTNFSRSVSYSSAGGTTTATINRADGSYSFKLTGANWVPDADVNYKLTGSNGGFTVITPTGEQELYDGYNQVYMVTGLAWAPKYTLTYDTTSAHLLKQVSDPFGHALNLTYDIQNRLVTMTDPNGGLYQYGYDANGNLFTVTYPDGKVRTYVYNEPAYTAGASLPTALTGIVDESNSRFTNFGYSTTGLAVLTEHAGGAEHSRLVTRHRPAPIRATSLMWPIKLNI